jgi:hypothetical protein
MNAQNAAPIVRDILAQIEKKHPDSGVYIKMHTADGEVVYIENITTNTDDTGNLIINLYE